jgi:membrane associated rhomboid family serine protease
VRRLPAAVWALVFVNAAIFLYEAQLSDPELMQFIARYGLIPAHLTVPAMGASGAISAGLGAYMLLFPTARVITLIPIEHAHVVRSLDDPLISHDPEHAFDEPLRRLIDVIPAGPIPEEAVIREEFQACLRPLDL